MCVAMEQDEHPLTGARIRFRPDVPIRYGQDFGFYRAPLPSDRDFWCRTVIGNGRACLVAPGYGVIGDYGCGAIFVSIRPESRRPPDRGRGEESDNA